MVSNKYLNKMRLLLNAKGNYTDEEVVRIANTLLRLCKTILNIMKYVDYGNTTQKQQTK